MNECPDPRLCDRLGWHVHGRHWEIWNNLGIDRAIADRIRQEWLAGRPPSAEDLAHKAPAPGPIVSVPRQLAPRGPCCKQVATYFDRVVLLHLARRPDR